MTNSIPLNDIKQVRQSTDASLADCMKALKIARGNIELAEAYLLHKNRITNHPIPRGYYAIDQYAKNLKQQALEEILLLKDKIHTPIKRMEFLSLDYNNVINYLSIDNDTYGIHLDLDTNIPNGRDYQLLSFCFQQLQKETHDIKKLLSWSGAFEFPKSLFLYEIISEIKHLVKVLLEENTLLDQNIDVYVEGFTINEEISSSYFNSSIISYYLLKEVTAIFNFNSFHECMHILYKNINLDFYNTCVEQFKHKGIAEIMRSLLER